MKNPSSIQNAATQEHGRRPAQPAGGQRGCAGPAVSLPGFTRVELLALLAGLGLLAAVAAPGLANPRARAEQVACLNNLRQILRAFHVWAAEHEDTLPWWYPAAKGGTSGDQSGLANNSWYQFSWISNELGTPKLLHDPADRQKRRADNWTTSPQGGFLNLAYRTQAVSYVLGIDASMLPGPGVDFALGQDHIVVMDRHTEIQRFTDNCSSGLKHLGEVMSPAGVGWKETDPAIHGAEAGNVGLLDGSVHQVNRAGLNRLYDTAEDTGSVHLLFP